MREDRLYDGTEYCRLATLRSNCSQTNVSLNLPREAFLFSERLPECRLMAPQGDEKQQLSTQSSMQQFAHPCLSFWMEMWVKATKVCLQSMTQSFQTRRQSSCICLHWTSTRLDLSTVDHGLQELMGSYPPCHSIGYWKMLGKSDLVFSCMPSGKSTRCL